MLGRSFEANLLNAIRLTNQSAFTGRAKIRFDPAQIALTFDQGLASFMLDLREAREISRETILNQFGMDQKDEALRREREAELYDETFGTIVPHGANPDSGGDPANPDVPTRLARRSGGRRGGGIRNGGGAAPGSGQGQETRDPRRSRTRREQMRAELEGYSRPELIETAGELADPIPRRHRLRAAELIEAIIAQLCDDDPPTFTEPPVVTDDIDDENDENDDDPEGEDQ
jgi:hypothetical protein